MTPLVHTCVWKMFWFQMIFFFGIITLVALGDFSLFVKHYFLGRPPLFGPFWTRGFPEGFHSNRPYHYIRGPSVISWSVFKCLRDRLLFFQIFCMKLGHRKGTKVTELDFWKKILGVSNRAKPPFWGYFWCFLSISLHPVIKLFWNFIYIISSTLSNT